MASLSFDSNSFYYIAVQHKNPELFEDESIEKYAKENPQYHYGTVNESDFSDVYSVEGSFERMLWAVPGALWNLAKAVYHFALAILHGTPLFYFTDYKNYFDAKLFTAGMDLQEAFGRIVTLVPNQDRYGLYLIEEAQFQRSCYNCFAIELVVKPPVPEPEQQDNGPEQGEEKIVKTLYDYKQLTLEERQERSVELGNDIDLEQVLGIEDEFLKNIPLYELKNDFEISAIKYAIMTEENFNNLTINDLDGLYLNQMAFIKKRMPKNTENLEVENLTKDSLASDILKIRNPNILANINNISFPKVAFAFFDNDQIKGIKLADCVEHVFDATEEEDMHERLSVFSDDEIVAEFNAENKKIEGWIAQFLTAEQKKKLNIAEIGPDVIDTIFDKKEGEGFLADMDIFSVYPTEDVRVAIEKRWLVDSYQVNLADKQLSDLKISEWSPEEIIAFFPENDDTNAVKLALLNKEEVQSARGNFPAYLEHLLPAD